MKDLCCYITLVLLLAATTVIADQTRATGVCGGDSEDGVCRFQQSMTCQEMIQSHAFTGGCCSLSTDPVTGNCVITISGGSCAFYDRCGVKCYFETCSAEGGCVIPYMFWTSESLEACPPSEIDVSNLQYEDECPHCSDEEPAPQTTKRVILKPHLTFIFEAGHEDLVEPTRMEILLLDKQTEKYVWDILQEEYAVKSVHLDNFVDSFAPSTQAGNFKHQFETRFSASIDISSEPSTEPIIPKSMAQLLATNDNLSKFVGQYARYYGESEDPVPNGPFFHVNTVQARIAAVGRVFDFTSD